MHDGMSDGWPKSLFKPVHMTPYTVISMETRNINGAIVQVLVIGTLGLVTGSNFENKWPRQDKCFSLAKNWKCLNLL